LLQAPDRRYIEHGGESVLGFFFCSVRTDKPCATVRRVRRNRGPAQEDLPWVYGWSA